MAVEIIFEFCQSLMTSTGYAGLFVLMSLESMIAPIPSEAVMPFAGLLAANGAFDLYTAALVSVLGSIAGSVLSYYIGLHAGRRAVLRFGRYMLVGEEELLHTEKWFKRWGEKAVFICRFVPIIRHLISIPAGVARMNLPKFLLYTLVGSMIWNGFLLYLGYSLKESWKLIYEFSRELDAVALIVIVVFVAWAAFKRVRRAKS